METIQLYKSERLTGKMHDIHGFSTANLENPFCQRCRENSSLVCAKCYARSTLLYRKAMREHYVDNGNMLSRPMADSEFPRTWEDVIRLETHGELLNLQHLQNYVRLCELNPQTQFTLWTKRVNLIREAALRGISQPSNLHIKISSPFLNRESHVDKTWYQAHGWNLTLFTVYDLAHATQEHKEITCGGRECRTCMKCYGNHAMEDIVELLKQDQKKVKE